MSSIVKFGNKKPVAAASSSAVQDDTVLVEEDMGELSVNPSDVVDDDESKKKKECKAAKNAKKSLKKVETYKPIVGFRPSEQKLLYKMLKICKDFQHRKMITYGKIATIVQQLQAIDEKEYAKAKAAKMGTFFVKRFTLRKIALWLTEQNMRDYDYKYIAQIYSTYKTYKSAVEMYADKPELVKKIDELPITTIRNVAVIGKNKMEPQKRLEIIEEVAEYDGTDKVSKVNELIDEALPAKKVKEVPVMKSANKLAEDVLEKLQALVGMVGESDDGGKTWKMKVNPFGDDEDKWISFVELVDEIGEQLGHITAMADNAAEMMEAENKGG